MFIAGHVLVIVHPRERRCVLVLIGHHPRIHNRPIMLAHHQHCIAMRDVLRRARLRLPLSYCCTCYCGLASSHACQTLHVSSESPCSAQQADARPTIATLPRLQLPVGPLGPQLCLQSVALQGLMAMGGRSAAHCQGQHLLARSALPRP